MLSTGRKIGVGIGMTIFALGLIGPLGVIGIGFGIGLVIGCLRNDNKRLKAKKRMTAKENNQLITTVLPITTNKK